MTGLPLHAHREPLLQTQNNTDVVDVQAVCHDMNTACAHLVAEFAFVLSQKRLHRSLQILNSNRT